MRICICCASQTKKQTHESGVQLCSSCADSSVSCAQVQVCGREEAALCTTGVIVVHQVRERAPPPLAPPRFVSPCDRVLDVSVPLARPLYLTHLLLAPPAHEAELRVVPEPPAGDAAASDPPPALRALFFVERSLWANSSLQLAPNAQLVFGVFY